jgi:hypothetical protein
MGTTNRVDVVLLWLAQRRNYIWEVGKRPRKRRMKRGEEGGKKKET